jgi:antitoxin component of RelBE/YafQ-DinJ toxin-antitoxin module
MKGNNMPIPQQRPVDNFHRAADEAYARMEKVLNQHFRLYGTGGLDHTEMVNMAVADVVFTATVPYDMSALSRKRLIDAATSYNCAIATIEALEFEECH